MNEHEKKAVLLFITVETCIGCKIYKMKKGEDGWMDLKHKLMTMSDIELVEIVLPTTDVNNLPVGYPEQIKKYIGWYPIFILIPWSNYYDPNIKNLNAQVYAGQWSPTHKRYIPIKSEFNLKTTSIIQWITTHLSSFSTPQILITDHGRPVGSINSQKSSKKIQSRQSFRKPKIHF